MQEKTTSKKPVEVIKTALLLTLAAITGVELITKTGIISKAVTDALYLCSKAVIPSLFPFLVFSSFIAKTSLLEKLGTLMSPITKALFGLSGNCGPVILMSLIGGFPIGPHMAAELCKEQKISKKEAGLLCLFSINAGPAFVIGTVGYSMLGSIKAGVLLYTSMIISSLLLGLMLCNSSRLRGTGKQFNKLQSNVKNSSQDSIQSLSQSSLNAPQNNSATLQSNSSPSQSNIKKYSQNSLNTSQEYSQDKTTFLEAFCASVNGSSVAMLQICAYVVIFSALTALLSDLPNIFKASLEVTAGCAMLCAEGSGALLLPSVAAMLSFCGFCVHAQVHDSISAGGLTYSKFLISRVACGGLSFLFCRAACLLFPNISEVFLSTSVPTYADVSLSAVACASMLFMSILLVLDLDIPKDLC
ncbi:MAG: hypothetical protein Q4A45_02590 [Clostridia bacterium]|nr:hypothetical protein [Clostridia bacterium]